ncbi:peptide chain release factor N(5)-glutamine methyltransferase [Marinobacteraceae bacterium S3BR75-40.1]
MTLAEAIRTVVPRFPADSPELDAQLLLAEAIRRDRTYLYTWPERQLTPEEQQRFEALAARRMAGEPVAHILERGAFWTLELKVAANTLIPRPETERLVEVVLELDLPDDARILDLGTGTGAIALALAAERPDWQVVATDRDDTIVALARENARLNALERVQFLVSDWFGALASSRYDLIVSNPPYIDPDDPHLAQGDVRFEPDTALVAQDGGLADLRHILQEARHWLTEGGVLAMEHGWDQADDVRTLMEDAGYEQVRLERDYGGRPRLTLGIWPGGR